MLFTGTGQREMTTCDALGSLRRGWSFSCPSYPRMLIRHRRQPAWEAGVISGLYRGSPGGNQQLGPSSSSTPSGWGR